MEDVEPTDLEYSMAEYVDLEAIDTLVEHDSMEWVLSFEIPDYIVTVANDRSVHVASKDGKPGA